MYQEIIYEAEPDYIIETGTRRGGSTLYLATICDIIGTGEVISVDIEDYGPPEHPRITYLLGDSAADGTIDRVSDHVEDGAEVMVILDADHSHEHVLAELHGYSGIVTPGQYLIAEDTLLDGSKTMYYPPGDTGPHSAVQEFLQSDAGRMFSIDRSKEKFMLTFSPGGFLRKEQ